MENFLQTIMLACLALMGAVMMAGMLYAVFTIGAPLVGHIALVAIGFLGLVAMLALFAYVLSMGARGGR